MDDLSSDATIYAAPILAAPADATSSSTNAASKSASSTTSGGARSAVRPGSRLTNPRRMTNSDFSVLNKPFASDAFTARDMKMFAPDAHASPQGASPQGASSQGASSQGASPQGASPQGAASQGAASQGAASQGQDTPKAQEPWRERILLVEDEPDIRNLLSHTLRSWGYAVQIAAEGEEALRLWSEAEESGRAQLILTDVQMPGLNGLELLRQVRASDADMPVIVMTAFSSNQALTRALRLHANDFVAKPIEIPELQTALDRALRARRHRQELDSERTRAARLQAVLETATAVNHEINNPLASISASAQLLRYHVDKYDLQKDSVASTQALTEEMDVAAMNRLLDVILEQCDRIADFNRKLSGVVNPVTRSSGGHKMLDVDSSR